jgi:maltose alpha-D-glucosyltransferase / alpha-amylase
MTKDSLWYKDAVFYQLHVKCFHDSNKDGIGDFKGLSKKLDHIQKLGCTAVWLLPFYPSPLRDDGYDIGDYMSVHPRYGTLKDFRDFLDEAHRRNLKVVTELVINHTSDQHKWFQRARKAPPGSKWRNYYVWSSNPDKFSEARIIFKDFEPSNWTWDSVAGEYYMHRFYSHQPDLNFENPEVHQEIFKVLDFWMDMGVDGMRLDAIPYLYKKEGTDCENLPETHVFLKKLRAHVDSKYSDRMLLAEANQWPEDAVAYFGQEDECHMAFNFPVMPRLFMSMRTEDRFPIIDIMEQTPTPPPTCQWATFLRNHDELTLEMVTEEERDYMYRSYAKDPRARINLGIRRRLAPLLDNGRSKMELMNILLFSLPGSPVIYYGDEIGMGDNYYLGDRDGVRTPMQWDTGKNGGFSEANPQQLYLPLIIDSEYHYAFLNVENQERSSSSFLWWMRNLVKVRKRYQAFSRGEMTFLKPTTSKVLAFIRKYEEELILVVVNLSANSQYVELNLGDYAGARLKDIFSQTDFCHLKEGPFGLMIGGHGYYWLSLEKESSLKNEGEPPELSLENSWKDIFTDEKKKAIFQKEVLGWYLPRCRWFRSKAKKIRQIQIEDALPMKHAVFLVLEVRYTDGEVEKYQLFLAHKAFGVSEDNARSIIAYTTIGNEKGMLIDALYDEEIRRSLVEDDILKKKIRKGITVRMLGQCTPEFQKKCEPSMIKNSTVISAEQSNTSIVYDESLILKFYREIEEGVNPDEELVRYLSFKNRFPHIPSFLGSLSLKGNSEEHTSIAMLQKYIPNAGDMWAHTLDVIRMMGESILTEGEEFAASISKDKEHLKETIGYHFLEMIRLLGVRTAEMHLALSEERANAAIAPESFTWMYQKSLFQSIRSQIKKSFDLLRESMPGLTEEERSSAEKVISKESAFMNLCRVLVNHKFSSSKIRIHGDFHLGQVLYTGDDLVMIDFEGEPLQPLSERRLKRSALQDVAGMIRSIHYATVAGFEKLKESTTVDSSLKIETVSSMVFEELKEAFLNGYLNAAATPPNAIVPLDSNDFNKLLVCFLIQKGSYEIAYELQNRPDWVSIPLKGMHRILEEYVK